MRILVWDNGLGNPRTAYRFWIVAGMEAVGHQVIAADAHALVSVFGIKAMQRLMLDYARAYRVQAVLLTPQAVCYTEPWLVQALRDLGVIVISFRFDDCMWAVPGKRRPSTDYLRKLSGLDRHSHLAVTAVRRATSLLADAALPEPIYVPFPVGWQAIPLVEGSRRRVITFAGSPKQRAGQPDSWRVKCIRALQHGGLPIQVHHDGWMDLPEFRDIANPTPPLTDYFRLLGSSLINLSPASDWSPGPFAQVRLLSLEIAAAGGMQIAYHADELFDYFDLGQAIETFTDVDELVIKARHYLQRPELAVAMGFRSRQAIEGTGGWELWWARVQAALAARGHDLDLSVGADVEADPAHAATLRLAATALAHLYEARGDRQQARLSYEEVLRYDSCDYAARSGLARLSETADEALPHWRAAANGVAYTDHIAVAPVFGLPGIHAEMITAFKTSAEREWFRIALQRDDPADLFEVLAALNEWEPRWVIEAASLLASRGRRSEAVSCYAMVIARWPDLQEATDLAAVLRIT